MMMRFANEEVVGSLPTLLDKIGVAINDPRYSGISTTTYRSSTETG